MNDFTIIEYFSLSASEQVYWLSQIGQGQWRAATYLHGLLRDGKMRGKYGSDARILLLTQEQELLAFCTYGHRDEIPDDSLFPWVGFVYTAPEHRGHRYSQKLIAHACAIAKQEGHRQIYLTSDHVGLYEKYGFAYLEDRTTVWNESTRLYVRFL